MGIGWHKYTSETLNGGTVVMYNLSLLIYRKGLSRSAQKYITSCAALGLGTIIIHNYVYSARTYDASHIV